MQLNENQTGQIMCNSSSGAELEIKIDLVEFQISILDDKKSMCHQFSSFNELDTFYKDYLEKKFEEDRYIDFGNRHNHILNLSKELKKIKPKQAVRTQLETLEDDFLSVITSEVEAFAKDHSIKKIDNIVLYWNENQCFLIYVNNPIAGSIEDIKIQIEKNPYWIMGLRLQDKNNTPLLSLEDESILVYAEDFDTAAQVFLYHLCDRLESKKSLSKAFMKLLSTDFKAFSIDHDYELIDFNLRETITKQPNLSLEKIIKQVIKK